jgi:small subunit ribosomal protein S20
MRAFRLQAGIQSRVCLGHRREFRRIGGGASATITRPAGRARFEAPSPMANIQQQKKRVDISARQRLENLRYRSTIKTLAKRLESAVTDGDADAVAAEHRELVRTIDRAAARGALHKNTAARKKSQAARVVRPAEAE